MFYISSLPGKALRTLVETRDLPAQLQKLFRKLKFSLQQVDLNRNNINARMMTINNFVILALFHIGWAAIENVNPINERDQGCFMKKKANIENKATE